MAAATAVKASEATPSVMDMIPVAEASQEYGDSETLSLANLTGGNGTVEIDLTPKESDAAIPAEAGKDKREKAAPTLDEETDDEAGEDGEETNQDESLAIAQALVEQFGTDPAAAMKALWDAAGGEAQSKFIKTIAGETQSAAAPEFEAQSDFETGLLPVFNDLKAIPEFKNNVTTAFGQHADFINDAHVQINALTAMVQTLASLNGVELPKADYDSMLKAVKSGKSYEEATKAFKGQLAKAAGKTKQANVDRPANSRNESGNRIVVDPKADLATMIRNYKETNQG